MVYNAKAQLSSSKNRLSAGDMAQRRKQKSQFPGGRPKPNPTGKNSPTKSPYARRLSPQVGGTKNRPPAPQQPAPPAPQPPAPPAPQNGPVMGPDGRPLPGQVWGPYVDNVGPYPQLPTPDPGPPFPGQGPQPQAAMPQTNQNQLPGGGPGPGPMTAPVPQFPQGLGGLGGLGGKPGLFNRKY